MLLLFLIHPGYTLNHEVKASGWMSHWPIRIKQHACPYLAVICCRVCPKASVWCTCPHPPSQLFSRSMPPEILRGRGLVLLDAAAVLEVCPVVGSADYMYADASQLTSQSPDQLHLLDLPTIHSRRQKRFPKRQGSNVQACRVNPACKSSGISRLHYVKYQQKLQLRSA